MDILYIYECLIYLTSLTYFNCFESFLILIQISQKKLMLDHILIDTDLWPNHRYIFQVNQWPLPQENPLQ